MFATRKVQVQLMLMAACVGLLCTQTLAQAPGDDARFDRKQERAWTDRNGNQQTATFAGVLGENLLLKVETQTIRMPLEQMSDDDIGWVAEVLRREGRSNQLPAKYRDYQPGDAAAAPAKPSPMPATADKNETDPPSNATAEAVAPSTTGEILEIREWTDRDGQKLKAKFQSVIADDVLLKPEQGAITRVPIRNLSPVDRRLLRDHFESRGELERLPAEFRNPVDVEAASEAQVALSTPDEKLRVIRTWTDDDGVQIVARFWSVDASAVTLQSETGRGTVSLGKLGYDDLIWLQEALREAGRLTELALPYRDPPDKSMSTVELARYRRTGYARKWTSFTGKTMVGQYDRFTQGQVRIFDTNGTPSESDYVDFSEQDQAYLRERLKREVPGEFFPTEATDDPPPREGSSEIRTWTDLDGKTLNGRFVKLDRSGTVVVLETGAGEKPYIAQFLSVDDQKKIKALIDAQNAAARAQAQQARADFENRRTTIMSGTGAMTPVPGPGQQGLTPPGFQSTPDISNLDQQTPPPLPVFEWSYKCDKCGTEFDESSGLKQGDKCPVCTKREDYLKYGVAGGTVLAAAVFYFLRQPDYARKSKSKKKRPKSVSH